MAHMQFDAAIDDLVRLDGPMQKGPVPRWQRKAIENSDVFRAKSSPRRRPSMPKTPVHTTPRRRAMLKSLGKTPKTGMTPTARRTPARKMSGQGKKTPKKTENGDRFIPNRALMDLDKSNYLLTNPDDSGDGDHSAKTEIQDKYKTAMQERLNQPGGESKILSFKQKAPKAQEGFNNNLKVLYSSSNSAATKGQCHRFIPTVPDRILDAPNLRDDFYLTLLDWGPTNQVAVALDNEVYLWNANNGSIAHLLEIENAQDYVTCVSWIQEGCVLAVGLSDGVIQLWDVEQKKPLRHMLGHGSRVGTLAWNQHLLSSGSRTGKIHHHDVRIPNHHIATLDSHSQEVCGLQWSPDGKYLASGGNDNVLNIWDSVATEPLYSFTQHQAAVKALGWCPWQPSVLASGGGTADRTIHFWNASTGSNLNSVNTGSQVSSILWSQEHKELISGHGYSQYQLTIWKYPTMAKVSHLKGRKNHHYDILSMCLSPDKTTVMSSAGDETLGMWKCFMPGTKRKKKKIKKSSRSISSILSRHINRVLSMCLSPDKTTVMSCAGDETLRLWKCFMPETKKKAAIKKSSGSISSSLSSMQIR